MEGNLMKKRIIAALMMLTLAFSSTAYSQTYTSSVNTSVEAKGSYSCYQTDSTVEYLNFLETFDYEKYEIFDVSHGYSDWYVTYRLKK